jgi:hypothetical protein
MANEHRHDKPKLPKFEPLPPTNLINRLINFIVAPIFYLLFTTIASIVIVPIYVIVDNFKHGRTARAIGSGFKRLPRSTRQTEQGLRVLARVRTKLWSSFVRKKGMTYALSMSGGYFAMLPGLFAYRTLA